MAITKRTQSLVQKELQNLITTYGADTINKAIKKTRVLVEEKSEKPEPIVLTIRVALEEFKEHWRYKQCSQATKKTYCNEMKQLSKFVTIHHQLPMGLDSPVTVFAENPLLLKEFVGTKYSRNTMNKKHAFLRTFLKVSNAWEENLERVLTIMEDPNRLPVAFSHEQLTELLGLARDNRNGFRDYAILWTYLGSGIRLSELPPIRIKDINCRDQTIMVYPKGRKDAPEVRVIHETALRVLQQFIEFTYGYLKTFMSSKDYNDLLVFTGTGGGRNTPIDCSTIDKMFRKLLNRAKTIPEDERQRFSIHKLRHTFAIFALRSGINIVAIMEMLGHRSLESVQRYLKLYDDDRKQAMKQHPFSNIRIPEFLTEDTSWDFYSNHTISSYGNNTRS